MFRKKYWVIFCSLLIISACGTAESGADENWPEDEEELTMVVPFPEGGSADRQARALTSELEEELGVPVVVDNREGGAGAVGTTSHYEGDPDDGSHFIYQSQPHFQATIFRDADYDIDDFDYIGLTHESPITIWANEDSNYETFEDLMTTIEENPGELSYSMISASWSDTSVQMLTDELQMEVTDVPYDGGAEIRTALLGGEVDFTASDIDGTLAGGGDDLHPLAMFSDEPYEHAPDIPLVNEELDDMGYDMEFPEISNARFIQVKSEFRENHPERYEELAEAVEEAANSDAFIEQGEDEHMYYTWESEEETRDRVEEAYELMSEYDYLFQ
ncbi:Bug family tripartite tricarboxylate transporter substrate binding protein [Natribacillus halophilus]|uniref:Tripartite-type tricarboxylate transporter, receptor component TctC n=1 Tax=Natribacillus halophilus TaxID=549003 RepID=A0A1G8SCG3_9BACI|nr:tripartite tricarboxylate transporter substrate-binding protein [Natribacillus halophilus]SDJ26908.1 Tripartite-type tricarboxylate transporter, receptor component TctC [Natribacillus halophilus]